ncbi:MAG TPA: DegT/DnrJ/EryC1/StrS family aminotransferase [Burkholderiales bacterium]|nr:DegT/DnrJ/EryC1/StrS family aminotransferase [Burkholderiales bacterium]
MSAATALKVPFIDLKQRYEEEKTELLACVERVVSQGHFVLTQEVSEFEQAAARYIGVKHVVGLNSGTDALMMALWAHGIGKGDEVITTPVSFVATTGSIVHVGAKPVYVDVREDQLIDPAKIEAAITPRTKAIMPVHWIGRIADMDAIMAVAKKHKLLVIEDAAQTMGAYYKGKHGGSHGNAAGYSAHPLKNLNALGDGGFMGTNDDEVARKVKLYRTHGLESRDSCVMYGVNSRLDTLNAEVLKFRLQRLKSVVDRRRRNVEIYRKLIKPGPVYIPPEKPHEHNSYVMFIVQAERRDELKDYLAARGIESLVYYGTALHLHKAAARLGYKRGDFPVAEKQCDRVLALPHHQHLTEEQIAYASEAVNKFYG